MKTNYSILTLVISLLYAIVMKYLPDFPISEEVFQILLGYLIIKVLNNGEVKELTGKVYAYFNPPVSKTLKKK